MNGIRCGRTRDISGRGRSSQRSSRLTSAVVDRIARDDSTEGYEDMSNEVDSNAFAAKERREIRKSERCNVYFLIF